MSINGPWKPGKIRQWVDGAGNPWQGTVSGMRETWCLIDEAGNPMRCNSLRYRFQFYKTKKIAQGVCDRINEGIARRALAEQEPERSTFEEF